MDGNPKQIKLGIRRAKGTAKNIWSKKLICECGSNFNKRVYHRNKTNTTFSYVCYNRKMHHVSKYKNTDYKLYEVKEVQEWKL